MDTSKLKRVLNFLEVSSIARFLGWSPMLFIFFRFFVCFVDFSGFFRFLSLFSFLIF